MKIVAILQNQWFKDPRRAKYQLETTFKGDREKFIRQWLFYRCLTGKRLKKELGEDLCDEIVWEETSRLIGGVSSSKFPADLNHLRAVIAKHGPNVVIAFGRIAHDAFTKIFEEFEQMPVASVPDWVKRGWSVVSSPHPAARGTEKLAQFRVAMAEVKNLVGKDKFLDASLGIPWSQGVKHGDTAGNEVVRA